MTAIPTPPRGIVPALPLHAVVTQRTPQRGELLAGRYQLQEPIGAGGVASVYRALQCSVNRPVAVKILQQATLGTHALGPRFEREALALAALSHPNIVRLQDYGVASGMQYLVMELAEGRTLRAAIDQDGPFTVERAVSLTRQLVHALAYAHERSIVHRDLKPLNLVVQALPHQPEHLKVLDFGFAKFLPGSHLEEGAPATQAGFAFGSPTYISPEQCAGDTVDGRADLYSVGVLLFEMLTGAPPFTGEIPDLLRQHLYAPAPRLAQVRPELAQYPRLQVLLDRALAKQRDERFPDAAALLTALDELAPSGIASARPSAQAHALAIAIAWLRPRLEFARTRLTHFTQIAWVATRIGSRYLWTHALLLWRSRVEPAWQRTHPYLRHWYEHAKRKVARIAKRR